MLTASLATTMTPLTEGTSGKEWLDERDQIKVINVSDLSLSGAGPCNSSNCKKLNYGISWEHKVSSPTLIFKKKKKKKKTCTHSAKSCNSHVNVAPLSDNQQ